MANKICVLPSNLNVSKSNSVGKTSPDFTKDGSCLHLHNETKQPLSSATHPRHLFTSPYRIIQGNAALKPSIPSSVETFPPTFHTKADSNCVAVRSSKCHHFYLATKT